MDSILNFFGKILSNPESQPLLDNLKKQNEQFRGVGKAQLLLDDDNSDEIDVEDKGSPENSNDDETLKELEIGLMEKISKLFEYTSVRDKCILFVGIICTMIHAASFPILAILFGKISNAYIAVTLREMRNTTLHPPHNASDQGVGATGKLALGFLTKVTTSMSEGLNASTIPNEDNVGSGGFLRNMTFYESSGLESLDDFAKYVAEFSLSYFYIGIAVFIASFLQTLSWEWVAEHQLYRIKQLFIYQLLRQEMAWFDRHASADLVIQMANDSQRFRDGVGQTFSIVIEYITIALLGAGIGLMVNTKLTLVFLASAPFVLTKIFLLWKKMAEKSSAAQKDFTKAAKISSEVMDSIRTVNALTCERKEVTRFTAVLTRATKSAEGLQSLVGIGVGGMNFLIYAFYAVALWYSVNLLASGAITPGEIYTVFFSLTICAFALGAFLPQLKGIADSYASILLLDPVLKSVPTIDPFSPSGERPKHFSGKIKFSHVTFWSPGKEDSPFLQDLNLEIPDSGTIAILGSSSFSKTALINLMLRFYDPQKGQVRLDTYDIKFLNVRWIREQISVVDEIGFLQQISIFEIIRSSRKEITLNTVVRAAKMALVHDFIMSLPQGYMTRVKLVGGKEFSLGQRQRICIAKNIVTNSNVLILCDAMSALDNKEAVHIQKILAKFREGLTTVIITSKAAIGRHADLIVVLENECVAEKGNHKDLVELNGIYVQMLADENVPKNVQAEEDISVAEVIEAEQQCPPLEAGPDTEHEEHRRQWRAEHKGKGFGQDEEIPSVMRVMRTMPMKHRRTFYLGILGCLLSALVIPIVALSLGQILHVFVGEREALFGSGIYWVEVLTGVAILAGMGCCMRTVCIGIASEQLAHSLCLGSFESILRQPFSWFEKKGNAPDQLHARLASGIPLIRDAVGPRFGIAVSAVMTMIIGVVISAIYVWQVALMASLTLVVLVVGFFGQQIVLKKSYMKITRLCKKLADLTDDIVDNIASIQSTCKAFDVCQKAESFIYPAFVEGQRRAIQYAWIYALSDGLMFFVFGASFRLGAELIRSGVLPISSLFTVFFVLTFGSLSLGQAMSFLPEYFQARWSSAFIFRLMDTKSTVDPFEPTGLKPVVKGQIEFRDVVFSYPQTPEVKTLQSINLTIPAGCSIGITGAAGCGKSTILSILERYYELESGGAVFIDGVNIKDFNVNYLRENYGFVSQEIKLFDVSIADNISYGYRGEATGDDLRALVEQAADAAGARFKTDEFPQQFDTPCGEDGNNLSAVQRQSLTLARAFINKPPIFLFDDPTSSMEDDEVERVRNSLHKSTRGRTTIIVSNSCSPLVQCEYVAVMLDGKIVEFGKQVDLFKAKGFYYKLAEEEGITIEDIAGEAQPSST